MKITSLFQKENNDIIDSIHLYKKALMDDMNLTLRITNNDQTYITKPVEWVENMLIFEAPMSQLDYVIYPPDAQLQIIFVSKSALFVTQINLCKSYRKNKSLYYVGEIIAPIEKKQQRSSFRLDVVIDTTFQLFPINMPINANFSTESLQSKKGTCINISTGGMCLTCNEQLHSRDHLILSFTLVETPITLHGEVLFIGEPTESGVYSHRIKFCGMSKSESNLLNHLIFEKQRLQLKHL